MAMEKKISVAEYFRYPETNRPMELVYGYVREPPAPFGEHQIAVFRIAKILDAHVEPRRLGRILISPLDVVLDKESDLVVQPDLLFVAHARLGIVRDRVWGPPDLTIEVLSPGTIRHDRRSKLEWYRRYGVAECWIVNPAGATLEVVDLKTHQRRSLEASARIRSNVLPRLATCVKRLL